MDKLIYKIADLILIVHDFLVKLIGMQDKQLHLLVTGIASILIYLIFYFVAKRSNIKSYIYSLLSCLIFSVAIEVLQELTNTGTKDILDIVYSMIGASIFCSTITCIKEVYSEL